jgi:hypothetical protein
LGDTNIDYWKWRPILDGIATLHEIDTYWDICNLADANEALDIKSDAEAYYAKGK